MHANEDALPLGVCLFRETWHQGVVGLVASRIKDRVHRPVIAMARADAQTLKGSARSVSGVHIRDVLDAVAARDPALIQKFGGHAMAAGLSIAADRFEDFCQAFDDEVRKWMTPEDARGILHSDGSLDARDFTLDTAHLLRVSGPWGQGFPEPLFDGHFGVADSKVVGDRHLKLRVRTLDGGATCEAIAFRHFDDDQAVDVPAHSQVSMAYRLDVNEYAGTERLQLIVEHLELVPRSD
jgi:single-stranded-DNA-specific exonuclease